MKPITRIPRLVVLVTLVVLLLVSVALAQTGDGASALLSTGFDLSWWTVDGGVGTSSGGPYMLSGTIGQPDAGELSGGSYTLGGGFWYGGAAAAEKHKIYLPIILKNY
jgi:hypothetical protein